MQFMKLNRYLCSCAVLGLLASCSDYLGEKPTSEWTDGYVWLKVFCTMHTRL